MYITERNFHLLKVYRVLYIIWYNIHLPPAENMLINKLWTMYHCHVPVMYQEDGKCHFTFSVSWYKQRHSWKHSPFTLLLGKTKENPTRKVLIIVGQNLEPLGWFLWWKKLLNIFTHVQTQLRTLIRCFHRIVINFQNLDIVNKPVNAYKDH